MLKTLFQLIFVSGVLLSLAACGGQNGEVQEEAAAQTETHQATGVIVSVDSASNVVTIRHQTIPGFMEAMTMPFRVQNPELLTAVQVDDSVNFTITVSNSKYFITDMNKVE